MSDCALLRREPGRPLLVAKPHSAGDLPLGLNAKPAPGTPRGSGEDTEDRQVGQPRTGTCGRGQARAPGPGPRSWLPASQAGGGACGRSENTLKIRTLQCSPENRLGAEITQQSHSMLRGPSRVLPGPQTRQRVSVHVKRDTSHTVSRRSGHPAPDRQLRVACSAAQQRPPPRTLLCLGPGLPLGGHTVNAGPWGRTERAEHSSPRSAAGNDGFVRTGCL